MVMVPKAGNSGHGSLGQTSHRQEKGSERKSSRQNVPNRAKSTATTKTRHTAHGIGKIRVSIGIQTEQSNGPEVDGRVDKPNTCEQGEDANKRSVKSTAHADVNPVTNDCGNNTPEDNPLCPKVLDETYSVSKIRSQSSDDEADVEEDIPEEEVSGVVVDGLEIRGRSVPIFLPNTRDPVVMDEDGSEGEADSWHEEDLVKVDSFITTDEAEPVNLTVKGTAIFPGLKDHNDNENETEDDDEIDRKINQMLETLKDIGKVHVMQEIFTVESVKLGKTAAAIRRRFIPVVVESYLAAQYELHSLHSTPQAGAICKFQADVSKALSSVIQTFDIISTLLTNNRHNDHVYLGKLLEQRHTNESLSDSSRGLVDTMNSLGGTLEGISTRGKQITLTELEFQQYLSACDPYEATQQIWYVNSTITDEISADLPPNEKSRSGGEEKGFDGGREDMCTNEEDHTPSIEKVVTGMAPSNVCATTSNSEQRTTVSEQTVDFQSTDKEDARQTYNSQITTETETQAEVTAVAVDAWKPQIKTVASLDRIKQPCGIFELLDYEYRVTNNTGADSICEEAVALCDAWRCHGELPAASHNSGKSNGRRHSLVDFITESDEEGDQSRQDKITPTPHSPADIARIRGRALSVDLRKKNECYPAIAVDSGQEKQQTKIIHTNDRNTSEVEDDDDALSPVIDPIGERDPADILWPPFQNITYPQSLSLGTPSSMRLDIPEIFPQPRTKTNNSLSTFGEDLQLPDKWKKKTHKKDDEDRGARKSRAKGN